MFKNVTGVLLAGGESRRMGRDKAGIELDGVTTAKRTIDAFRPLFADIFAVSKKTGRFADLDCREVADVFDEMGAMVGVLTALGEANTEYIFVAACDMPFIDRHVVELIVARGAGFKAALPLISGKGDPLHALYSRDCYEAMLDFMKKEGKSLNRFIESLPSDEVRYVSEDEIRAVDPGALSLFNMNTPEDLEKAKKLSDRDK
ncbi:MAG: molybdenum cofactor guanylyltransferase [bacterium]|nr:molybdenum cofactor guanylyltransferase [bacterium]